MKKILVIDDDHFNRIFVKEALASTEHQVLEAADGESGIKVAEAERPDLILLDIVMPGLDGIEVCRRIKENSALKGTPVLMFSSLDETKLIEVAFKMGAIDYIIKPANAIQLQARVEINLRLRECERRLAEAMEEIERLREGGGVIDLMEEA